MISQAGAAEADEIAGFLQGAYQRAYAGRHAMTIEMFAADTFRRRTADSLRRQLADPDVFFLTTRDQTGALLATIGLRPDRDAAMRSPEVLSAGEVWGFYVDPGCQHRGHGRTLWSALMAAAPTAAYDELYLHVVTGSNDAVAFYERRGFVLADDEGSWDWPSWDPPAYTPYRTMRRRSPR